MSWLSSVESLLNKVDQAAGQALQKEGGEGEIKPLSHSSNHRAPATRKPLPQTARASSSSSSQWQPPQKLLGDASTSYSPFLGDTKINTRQGATGKQVSASLQADSSSSSTTINVECEAESTSCSSTAENSGGRVSSRSWEDSNARRQSNASNGSRRSADDQLVNDHGAAVYDVTDDGIISDGTQSGSGSHSHAEDDDGVDVSGQSSRDLVRENMLLKNEIESLNDEMQSVIRRIHSLQEELNSTQSKYTSQMQQLSQSEQISRELMSRENDMRETLTVKETQLAVLKERLDEADRELEAKKKQIRSLQSDRDRILEDQSCSTGMQGQALNTLQQKLTIAEEALFHEQEQHRQLQEEWSQRQRKLELDKDGITAELGVLQQNIVKERAHNAEITALLKTSRCQTEAAKQELIEYKDKAARILQSKDRLIASLKDGAAAPSGGAESSVLLSELDTARQELSALRDELQSSQINIDNLRAEIADLESQLQQETDSSREQVSSLEEMLKVEKRRREDVELENNRQKQELRYVNEELLKQKTALQSRIQERDADISRLRNQLTMKSVNATNEEELENRLHSLTESLIHKQAMLEALNTDKSSLLLQLERMEKQYRASEAAALKATAAVASVHIHDDDEVRERGQGIMSESPYDGRVTRKVKIAANTIDRFSMRLGRFLRQYPVVRVFIIIYMGVLHLWVMIVLLTYQPEMHESSYQPHI